MDIVQGHASPRRFERAIKIQSITKAKNKTYNCLAANSKNQREIYHCKKTKSSLNSRVHRIHFILLIEIPVFPAIFFRFLARICRAFCILTVWGSGKC